MEENLAVIEENSHTNEQGWMEIDQNLSKTITDLQQRQKGEARGQQIMQTLLSKQQEVKELLHLWKSYRTDVEGQ